MNKIFEFVSKHKYKLIIVFVIMFIVIWMYGCEKENDAYTITSSKKSDTTYKMEIAQIVNLEMISDHYIVCRT